MKGFEGVDYHKSDESSIPSGTPSVSPSTSERVVWINKMTRRWDHCNQNPKRYELIPWNTELPPEIAQNQ